MLNRLYFVYLNKIYIAIPITLSGGFIVEVMGNFTSLPTTLIT